MTASSAPSSTPSQRGVSALEIPVDTVARPATVIPESAALPEAWARLCDDADRCGVVVREGLPVAVVTAGGLAERWPGGGPLVQHRRRVRDVLDPPCGVEVLGAEESLRHGGLRLLATGLPALPVRPRADGALRVLTVAGLLAALLSPLTIRADISTR